jgi:Carboxypeptidase controlling helical cell shape catalytic/C-terminal domain of metallo-carboxypeptidase
MKLFLSTIFLLVFACPLLATDFDFYRQSGEHSGPTLLVIGGIDGDEPGGFHAAATLMTHYQIQRGHLWIVPNLNVGDIIKRQRGKMNLKFASLAKNDSYYNEVSAIKKIITNPQVDLVLNLHDGSGFYHPQRISSQRNPQRWGQSCVIDQDRIAQARFGELQTLATNTIREINKNIPSKDYTFQLKNVDTNNAEKNIPARKSLSFFAIRNNKPAIAIEASKKQPVNMRTYYHLLALENFMRQMNIDFSRDFPLTPEGVKQVIRDDAQISLASGRIQLELNNMRPTLNNFPLPDSAKPSFSTVNPLISLQQEGKRYRIHYGNNRLALLKPRFYPLDQTISDVGITIDGQEYKVPFGTIIPVSNKFKINTLSGYKTNVVGFAKSGQSDDGRTTIAQKQLNRKYSVDKAGKIYRVEIYKKDRFSGMILVDFRPMSIKKEPLVAQTARKDKIKIERHN